MNLSSFFLKRFCVAFSSVFSLLMVVFATSDLILRGSVIPGHLIPSFMLAMLPTIAVVLLPLASGLGVVFSIGSLFQHNELLFVLYVWRARYALHWTICGISLVLGLIYGILVLHFAPHSHLYGKQMVYEAAKDQLLHLESGLFHTTFPCCTLYFKKKSVDMLQKCMFHEIFLSYEKNGEHFIFSAHQGAYHQGIITLLQGSFFSFERPHHIVSFKTIDINTDSLISIPRQDVNHYPLKYKDVYALLASDDATQAHHELYKRLFQLAWQMIFPFLALFIVYFVGNKRHGLMMAILLVSGLFIFSYALVAIV